MDWPEPTIIAYGVKSWMNEDYTGKDDALRATPSERNLETSAPGLLRTNPLADAERRRR
jgi:hypothetical protein